MEEKPNFNVIEKIKHGGQKDVFLVEHNGSKMIYKVGKCNSINSLKRIIREVNILRELDSTYFPKNYFFSYDEKKGTFEIIEEYIEGQTLNKCRQNYDTEETIAHLMINIIEGMKILWSKEIIHRDLKPENIIISKKDNKPVIIDLGIAKSLLEESYTKTILPMGPCTIPYASPEQLQNQKNIISCRSDFFSLGIIAMELYNRHNPFDPKWVGSGINIRDNIISGNKRIDEKDTIKSKEFIEIFTRCLEVDPYNRYRKYTMLEDKLKNFIKEEIDE